MKLPSKALAVTAALAVVASATFGAFHYTSAQTPPPTPTAPAATNNTGQQAVQAFVDKVAANLNVSPQQLTTAVKDAALQTVDQQVAAGKLTQAQGDKIKAAINNGKYPELARLFARREERRERGVQWLRRQIVVSSAKAIGIEPKALVTDLKDGQSIADVAAAHNVALNTVKTQITGDVQAKLNTLVQDKKITQARADAVMKALTNNLDKILNHHRGDKSTTPAPAATPGA
ncbi:MAG: hypothetical protein KGK07_05360 [Chloroflexota bacterium]|nr:hypothetical protein [Chloroflexota bacterium]